MIGCRDYDRDQERRVHEAKHDVECFPQLGFWGLASSDAAEYTGMVNENAADAEGVAEVKTRHGSELVDEFPLGPDAFGVVVVNGVKETVLGGEEARRGAGIEGEDGEGDKVEESHGAAEDGERGVIWGSIVVPPEASNGSRNMDERVGTVEEGKH